MSKKTKILEDILDTLKNYNHKTFKLTFCSIDVALKTEELLKLSLFLKDQIKFNDLGIKRPKCINQGKPSKEYKSHMNEYLSQFGFEFSYYMSPSTSLYEAIASYAEFNYNKKHIV